MRNWIVINRTGLAILTLVLIFCTGIYYWLSTDTISDKIYRLSIEHLHLILYNRQNEADTLLIETLDKHIVDGVINKNWAPLANQLSSGYKRLQYSIPVIAGSPDNEDYYAEIAILLEMAPSTFHEQVKPRYLYDLGNITDINQALLEKYGLVNTEPLSSENL